MLTNAEKGGKLVNKRLTTADRDVEIKNAKKPLKIHQKNTKIKLILLRRGEGRAWQMLTNSDKSGKNMQQL